MKAQPICTTGRLVFLSVFLACACCGSIGAEIGGGDSADALHWLAFHQEPDGHWDAMKYGSAEKTDTACTGFALLAILSGGHTEKVGAYKDNVRRAVQWLKSKQMANGLICDPADAGALSGEGFPHAVSLFALAEAAGMANVPETRNAAQAAVDYCTNVHQETLGAVKGGWGFMAKDPGDLNATVWFIMALKSAKVAGLRVDPAAFEGALKFLDSVEHKLGNETDHGAGPASVYWRAKNVEDPAQAHVLTAMGALARQFLGWRKDALQACVEGFVARGGVPDYGHVDLYYWHHGSLCAFQQGGDLWKKWNAAMKACLNANQRKDGDEAGSWDPDGAHSTEWGRVGQTALSCSCLEVYYRYLILTPDK